MKMMNKSSPKIRCIRNGSIEPLFWFALGHEICGINVKLTDLQQLYDAVNSKSTGISKKNVNDMPKSCWFYAKNNLGSSDIKEGKMYT